MALCTKVEQLEIYFGERVGLGATFGYKAKIKAQRFGFKDSFILIAWDTIVRHYGRYVGVACVVEGGRTLDPKRYSATDDLEQELRKTNEENLDRPLRAEQAKREEACLYHLPAASVRSLELKVGLRQSLDNLDSYQ
jgi:hypothetical protein